MKKNKNYKLAATTILYNPEDNVLENISSYAKNVDVLIIIDNSTIHNDNIINHLKDKYPHIIYINNNDNLGIATALNTACEKAIELECDFILTMDQDSQFLNFEHYINCLYKLDDTSNISLLAANTTYNALDQLKSSPTCKSEEKFIVITSGNLLNLKLFNDIGRFEDKLFIDLVDYDYCLKSHLQKKKILYFDDVLIEHNIGAVFERKNLITRKVRRKIEHNPQRTYYFARNYLYLASKFSKKFPKEMGFLKTLNIIFIHEVTKIILYESDKGKKLYAKLIGLLHFLFKRYGKYNL